MKTSFKQLSTGIASVFALGFLTAVSSTAHALTWDDAGPTNTWSTNAVDSNWLPGNVSWTNGATAIFAGAGEAVTVGATNLDIGAISFTGGAYPINIALAEHTFTGAGISNPSPNPQAITNSGVVHFTGASTAGPASVTIVNLGDLSFEGTSTAGSANISNSGNLTFSDTASGGTAAISNDGNLDIEPSAAATVAVGSLVNNLGGVYVGDNKLQISAGLTLATGPGNTFGYTLLTPATSGTVAVTGGTFTGAGPGGVTITVNIGGPLAGTYDLIDWTGATAVGVELGDFVLDQPVPGYTLQINGSKLQLVSAASSLGDIIWHQPLARPGMSEDTDPSAGGTLKYRFKKGSTLPIKIHVISSLGNDVTTNSNISGKVAVFGDTNCDGIADNAVELTIGYNGVGDPGGVMDKVGGHLKYNLDTKKLPSISSTNCYILQVTVTDSSTGNTLSETVPLQAK